MGSVTLPYTLTPGTPENVAHVQANDEALRDAVNANLDASNLKNGTVTGPKLSIVSGGTSSSVTVDRINNTWVNDLSVTRTFTGKPVLMIYTAKCETYGPPAPGEAQGRINIDGTTVSQTFGVSSYSGGGEFLQLVVMHYTAAITAGSRVVTAQIRNSFNDGRHAAFYGRSFAVVEL